MIPLYPPFLISSASRTVRPRRHSDNLISDNHNSENDGCQAQCSSIIFFFSYWSTKGSKRLIIKQSSFSTAYNIYVFIRRIFSGSSAWRRNFRHLAPPENNRLLLFQRIFLRFCKLQRSSQGDSCNCRSTQGHTFLPDIQPQTPFSPEEESVPRLHIAFIWIHFVCLCSCSHWAYLEFY